MKWDSPHIQAKMSVELATALAHCEHYGLSRLEAVLTNLIQQNLEGK
jgi:hypothetical protein